MSITDFRAARERLRPWAELTTSTLISLRTLKAKAGDSIEVERITAELNRRTAADTKYGVS
jgi:hypothetical protein